MDEEIELAIIQSSIQVEMWMWNQLCDDENVRNILSTFYGIEVET